MTIELTKVEIEVLQDILGTYNIIAGSMRMQTPDREKAYEKLIKIFRIEE